jgi:DNA-binding NarL/FixJ family response regulator
VLTTVEDAMDVLVIDPHPIFRRGLAAHLRELPAVARVVEAATIDEARLGGALGASRVVLVDHDLPGAGSLLRELAGMPATDVVVLLPRTDGDVVDAVQAGAAGLLDKETLTPEMLAGAVDAAANGTTVIVPGLLAGLADRAGTPAAGGGDEPGVVNGNGNGHRRPTTAWLTSREQRVLRLVAEGHPTREVASRLSYSERTVKNVLHDVVTKLGARSRSHAVAHAVRDGLI